MQHNSWSKGASLPSVIFVFGNMVYIVWSSSLLTASKVSFGWCLSKQSCSSFILITERELSVFTLEDWRSSVSALLAGAECPPPLARVQQASLHASSRLTCTSACLLCSAVWPCQKFWCADIFILHLVLSCVSCRSCTIERRELWHLCLMEAMPCAAMYDLSKTAGHGKSGSTGAFGAGGDLESLQLHWSLHWEQ